MSSEAAADSAEVRAAAEADAEAKALAEARASQQRLAAAAEAAAAARAQCDLECKARRDAELRTSSMERLLREQLDETLKQAEAASIASSIAASLVYRASLSDLEEEIESERQTHRKVLEASRTRAVKMLAAKDELLVKARAGAEEAHRAKRSGVSAGINTERSTERADSSPTESSPPESSQGLGTPALAAKQLAAGDEEALASRFAHRITSLEGALNASREQLTQLRSEHEEALRQKKLLGARVSRAERASRHGSSEYIHNVMVRYLSLPESERAAMIPVLAALFGFNAVETAHVVAAATPQQGGLRGWVFGTPRTPSMATPRRVPAHLSTPFARAHLASEPRVGWAAAAGGGGGALERAAAERVSR